jgi:hypothetical protein
MSNGIAAQAQEDAAAPKAIQIQARKNAGNLPYRFFFDAQKRVQGYLLPEPRMFDALYRISFTELPMPDRDAYQPAKWGVSIVSDSVDQILDIRRGGYFRLPDNPQAYKEDATLMFSEQSRHNFLDVGWVLRIGSQQRLSYADFGKAMTEIRAVQKTIPFYRVSLITEKNAKYDGIKACFLEPGGALLIDGKPAADATVGNCAVLKFDPSRAASGATIAFSGPLDIVTIVETAPYLPGRT